MRHSISAGPTCWGSGAGADQIRSLGRRLGRYLVVGSTAPVPERVLVRPQDSNRPDMCLGSSQLGAHGPADPQACVRFAPVAARQPLANARLRADARARDGGIPKKLAAGVKASRRRAASIQDTPRTYRSLRVRLSVRQNRLRGPPPSPLVA